MRTNTLFLLAGTLAACGDRFTLSDEHPDGGPSSTEDGSAGSSGSSSRGGAAGSSAGGESGSGTGGESGTGISGAPASGGAASGGAGAGGAVSGGSAGAFVDGGDCQPQNTVDSCGPLCESCVAPDDRTVPTCNEGTCGYSCLEDDAECSDGSCSRLVWSFDSGELDGITAVDTAGEPLEVGSFGGTLALGVTVAQLNAIPEIRFTLPICNSGTLDVRSRTFSFRVYFDGTPPSSVEFYVQAALPDPNSGGYLNQIGAGTGAWTDYSAPLNLSPFSASAATITIQAGTLGGGFSGTIWFDDFRIE